MTKLAEAYKDGIMEVFASSGLRLGMAEKIASVIASNIEKEASLFNFSDDNEDKPGWLSRNKGWIIPLLVGGGAWYIGSMAERHGDPSKSIFANTGNLLYNVARHIIRPQVRGAVSAEKAFDLA